MAVHLMEEAITMKTGFLRTSRSSSQLPQTSARKGVSRSDCHGKAISRLEGGMR